MTTAVFDTLKASDNLKAAGIEAKQAEAIVHTMAGAFEDTVATKSDLKIEIGSVRADLDKLEASVKADIVAVKAELKQDIDEVKAEMKATATKSDVAELKSDLLKVAIMGAIGIILANATMTIALIRFLS